MRMRKAHREAEKGDTVGVSEQINAKDVSERRNRKKLHFVFVLGATREQVGMENCLLINFNSAKFSLAITGLT